MLRAENSIDQADQNLSPSDSTLRMRCPSCRKLYSVEHSFVSRFAPDEEGPRFQCVECERHFVAMVPQNLASGFLDTVTEDTVRERRARVAAVGAPLAIDREASAQAASDLMLGGNHELIALWEQVLLDYGNEQSHERFIAGACARGALAFAASKYKSLLDVAPGEEIAQRMRQRIMAMASHRFEVIAKLEASSRRSSLPLPSFNALLLLAGSFVFFVGVFMPVATNFKGLGISMFALAMGIRLFVRKPMSPIR